jgi:dTDP-4-dehydrorhamnose reductase
MTRIVVLGAAGMLGHKVCAELARRGHSVVGTLRRPFPRLAALLAGVELRAGLDVLEEGSVERLVADVKPDVVINAVGVVKQLAQNRDALAGVNAALPHRLVRACRRAGARLVHMSTDCVFSGKRGRYTEADPCDPTDAYGWSKHLGEPDPAETCALTIRSSLIGRELHRPTHGLVEWLYARRKTTVKGFSRAVFSGLTSLEMARVMAGVVEKPLHGLHHVAAAPIDKFDLLLRVRDAAKLDVEIQRDETFTCDRSLVMDGFAKATGYSPPSWDAMVREMCADPAPYDDIQELETTA